MAQQHCFKAGRYYTEQSRNCVCSGSVWLKCLLTALLAQYNVEILELRRRHEFKVDFLQRLHPSTRVLAPDSCRCLICNS